MDSQLPCISFMSYCYYVTIILWLAGFCLGLPRWAGTREVKSKTNLDFLEQEAVSGSGIGQIWIQGFQQDPMIMGPAGSTKSTRILNTSSQYSHTIFLWPLKHIITEIIYSQEMGIALFMPSLQQQHLTWKQNQLLPSMLWHCWLGILLRHPFNGPLSRTIWVKGKTNLDLLPKARDSEW